METINDLVSFFKEKRKEIQEGRMTPEQIAQREQARQAENAYWQALDDVDIEEPTPEYLSRVYWMLATEEYRIGKLKWVDSHDSIIACLIASEIGYSSAIDYAGRKGFDIEPFKGVLISGPVGIGKTSIFRRLFKYPHFRGRIVSCIEMQKEVEQKGYEALSKYEKDVPIVFDDLGLENETNHYGTKINPVHDVMMKRYDLFEVNGTKTHFTTNLTGKEITGKYGNRFADRLKAMCSFVKVEGKSFRGV